MVKSFLGLVGARLCAPRQGSGNRCGIIKFGSAGATLRTPSQGCEGRVFRRTSETGTPASQPAAFTIPVEPLGFFAPGAIYQGQRESLVSLDFLDEDHLLFTFHAPGLIRREDNPAAGNERQIRAVVLELPTGTVNAEALWTVHDRGRYCGC